MGRSYAENNGTLCRGGTIVWRLARFNLFYRFEIMHISHILGNEQCGKNQARTNYDYNKRN
jgi:hypothetical protein